MIVNTGSGHIRARRNVDSERSETYMVNYITACMQVCTYLAFIRKRGAGLSAFDFMTEDEDLSWLLSKELALG